MRDRIHDLLVSYYFGSIGEADRLEVERGLLCDSELLVDYLDLKRRIEGAEAVPEPSAKVWYRLQDRLAANRRWLIPASLGFALACAIVIWSFFALHPKTAPSEILFDSNAELSETSGVL